MSIKQMSSVLRSKAQIDAPTKFQAVTTPSYYDTTFFPAEDVSGTFLPVPFTMNNGVLDIELRNNVSTDFISAAYTPYCGPNYQVKLMGGASPVTSLGPNMTTWLNNWTCSGGENQYTILVPGLMTKAQFSPDKSIVFGNTNPFYIGTGSAVSATNVAPTGDEFVVGGEAESYYTVWLFKKPVVIRYGCPSESGGFRYLTLNSDFSPCNPVVYGPP